MRRSMNHSLIQTLLLAGLLPLALSACNTKGESVQEMMGMDRSGPDAFNVVSRPPLSMPPEFELRPPAPVGTPGPGEPRMDNIARGLITGEEPEASTAVISVGSTGLESTGERSLMEKFGAVKADPMIREQLTSDQYLKKEESSWLDDVIPSLSEQKVKEQLDPIEEAEKLRDDSSLKDSVQAPPKEFLDKAPKASKKTTTSVPVKPAASSEDDGKVKDLRNQLPAPTDATKE